MNTAIEETHDAERETRAVVPVEADLTPTMVTDIRATRARLEQLQQFVREVMVEGEDFGIIPGSTRKILLKPGAEKLCEVYAYAQQIEVVNRVEDWERPFFHYEVRCDLVSKRTGHVVGTGVGSCNSLETKYRWRDAQRQCPTCGTAAIVKGKEEYGGGWLCFSKKGGCGAKFTDADPKILGQTIGRIENDEVFTLVNTFLKMAKKRAVVDATLSVTRSSALFTQDEEVIEAQTRTEGKPPIQPPQRKSAATVDPSGSSAAGGSTTGRTCTAAQEKLIKAKANAAKIGLGDLHTAFNVEHVGDILMDDVDAVLSWIGEQAQTG